MKVADSRDRQVCLQEEFSATEVSKAFRINRSEVIENVSLRKIFLYFEEIRVEVE